MTIQLSIHEHASLWSYWLNSLYLVLGSTLKIVKPL